MALVSLQKVSFDYGGHPILDEVALEIERGERVGLVGENGSGKSSLFRLLLGIEKPVEGTLTLARHLTLGYLPQETALRTTDQTVFEAVAELSPELVRLSARLRDLQHRLEDPAAAADAKLMARLLDELGEAQSRFEALGGYDVEANVEAVLTSLGFGREFHAREVRSLSGGERKFVHLARIVLQSPDLLLLDEPDNHLDIDAKAWLESFILRYPGAVVVISHDRYLLDRVATKIVQLEDGQLEVFAGNYSYYREERERRLLRRHEQYQDQQEEIKRLEATLRQLKEWAKQNPKFAPRAESMAKRVERARREASERPRLRRERMKVSFDAARGGTKVLACHGLTKSIGGRTLFRPFDLEIVNGERVGIVGPNGAGKTTFLKLITGALEPDAGRFRIGASVNLGYYSQEAETLPLERTPLDYIRSLRSGTEQQAIGTLRRLLFSFEEAHTPIKRLSGGEKSRLQLARLMLTDANFLVLDEPTNNLDIASIEVLEEAIDDFDGTVLCVSHDRYFLDRIATRTVVVDYQGNVLFFPGNFSYALDCYQSAGERLWQAV